MSAPRSLKGVAIVFKIAISVALIGIALRGVELGDLQANLRAFSPGSLAVLGATALVVAPVHAARWVLVIAGSGQSMTARVATQLVYIGYFFSQVLPSSVGGDAVRMWCAWRAGLRLGVAFSTVVLERAIGLCAQIVLMTLALPWLLARVEGPARVAVVSIVAAGLAGFALLAVLIPHAERVPQRGPLRALRQFLLLARALASARKRLVPLVVTSGAGTLLSLTIVYLAARGVGAPLSWFDCVVLVTPVLVVSALPISIAGWGVRESAMIVALGHAQIGQATALTVSVTFGLASAAASLPGLWFWARGGHHLADLRAAGDIGEASDPGS